VSQTGVAADSRVKRRGWPRAANRPASMEAAMTKDPVCEMTVDEKKAPATAVFQGKTYHFCSPGCKATFEKDPARYAKA
jgi:YHS domain-containing protein